jgi:hypothetical protein
VSLAAARIAMRSIARYSRDKGAQELAEEALRALDAVELDVEILARRRAADRERTKRRRTGG